MSYVDSTFVRSDRYTPTSHIFPHLFDVSDDTSDDVEGNREKQQYRAYGNVDDHPITPNSLSSMPLLPMPSADYDSSASASESSTGTARPLKARRALRSRPSSSKLTLDHMPAFSPVPSSSTSQRTPASSAIPNFSKVSSKVETFFKIIFIWTLSLSLLVYLTCDMLKSLAIRRSQPATSKAMDTMTTSPLKRVTPSNSLKGKRSKSSTSLRRTSSRGSNTGSVASQNGSAPSSRRSSQANLLRLTQVEP